MKVGYLRRSIVGTIGVAAFFSAAALAVSEVSVTDGLQFIGENTGDLAGSSVASVGDINSDGFDDFVVGAQSEDAGGSGAGAVYLFYGGVDLSNLDLEDADVKIIGENAFDFAGFSVAGAGDVNGDGVPDVFIGANGNDEGGSSAGAAYLIYGPIGTEQLDLSAADAKFVGETGGDSAGQSVARAGDVNGDGVDDILIGAHSSDAGAGQDAGSTYLFYGGSGLSALSGTIDLSTADIRFTGASVNGFSGFDVVGAGDVNGDGFDDMLIGARNESSVASFAGAAYLVYGSASLASGDISLNTANVTFTGENANDSAGYAVGAADLNGDSLSDIIVGAPGYSSSTGRVYIVYGGSGVDELSGTVSLTAADATFDGAAAGDLTGRSLEGLADVNGDTFADLIIGAEQADAEAAEDAGVSYVLLGGSGVDELSGVMSADIQIAGATESDESGNAVSSAGDVNGDGRTDVLIGASKDSAGGSSVGALYLGYVTIDVDGDGEGSSGGFLPGGDCDDTNGSVSTELVLYEDGDGDGLGDPSTETSICAGAAPEGYVDDSSDTNDAVPNNGVEIPGDNVDNDGDGEIDEDNTVDDNDQHPGYKDKDPTDPEEYANSVQSLQGGVNGTIRVTFADNSVYVYEVFDITTDAPTLVMSYNSTAYAVVVHPQGRQLALVNVYTGTVHSTKTLSAKKSYAQTNLKVLDVRSDSSKEVVVTS